MLRSIWHVIFYLFLHNTSLDDQEKREIKNSSHTNDKHHAFLMASTSLMYFYYLICIFVR